MPTADEDRKSDAKQPEPTPLAEPDAKQLRKIAHDINNALELIVQASYLVNTTQLSDQAREWMRLLDQGVQQATELNRQIRDYVLARSQS